MPKQNGNGLPAGLLKDFNPRQPGLLGFLQSPEVMALGQGLLAGAQPGAHNPNGSFGGALSHAFGHVTARGDKESEKLRELAKLEMLKGHLDIDKAKLSLEREKVAQTLAEKAAQRKLLNDILTGTDSGKEALGMEPTSEQKKRAATLAAAGYTDKAFEVLTEKDPTLSATNTTISDNQELIQSADAVIPELEALLEFEPPDRSRIPGLGWIAGVVDPNKAAWEQSLNKRILGNLTTALGKKATEANIEATKGMITRIPGESLDNYHDRIRNIIEDVKSKKHYATGIVRPLSGNKNSNSAPTVSEMITITNPKTGETKQVSRAEYEAGRRK